MAVLCQASFFCLKQKNGASDDDEEEDENENEAEVDSSQMPHVISVFDLRKCTDPVLTIKVSVVYFTTEAFLLVF
ncbi:unnamed protein product [Cylicostephanus goldi]|uniref:Uncharacterized protein n=1 Tax=Cylicostephanus goldi TaxID=71465 RepID=A0A3P7QZD7_CYLGO|nr:unnamed protein product [Cylicostephanus goldi]